MAKNMDCTCCGMEDYQNLVQINKSWKVAYDKLTKEMNEMKAKNKELSTQINDVSSKYHEILEEKERLNKHCKTLDNEIKNANQTVVDLVQKNIALQSTTSKVTYNIQNMSKSSKINEARSSGYVTTAKGSERRKTKQKKLTDEEEQKKILETFSVPGIHLPGTLYAPNLVREAVDTEVVNAKEENERKTQRLLRRTFEKYNSL